MTAQRDFDRMIVAFLEDGPRVLPARSYDAVRTVIEHTRQRVVIGPWRIDQVTRYATYGIAAAAVVLIAVLGIQILPRLNSVAPGATATPSGTYRPSLAATADATSSPSSTANATASPAPSATPTDAASAPVEDPSGPLPAGTYVAHPFDALIGDHDARGFAFTTPSADWVAVENLDPRCLGEGPCPWPSRTVGVAHYDDRPYDPGAVELGFLKVASLNGDACRWDGASDDIAIGATAEDLAAALADATTIDAGEPYMESVSNAEGQGLELTMPATLPLLRTCDEGTYRIWNASGSDILPSSVRSNTWRLGIFDVDGERYVVWASYTPETPARFYDELDSIFDSVHIDPAPGCSRYAGTCN